MQRDSTPERPAPKPFTRLTLAEPPNACCHPEVVGFAVGLRAVFVLSCICVTHGCNKTDFELTLGWEDDPPEPGSVFLSGRIEDRSAAEARTIATAGFVSYQPGARLEFKDVPLGANRVCIVEGRPVPDSVVLPTYYGESEPFELVAERRTEIAVRLALRRPPQAGTRLVLDVEGTGGRRADSEAVRVNAHPITLRIWARGANTVRVSNSSGFERSQLFSLANPEVCEDDGFCLYRIPDWPLSDTIDVCEAQAFCVFRVWARLIDENDYESTEFSREVIYDVRAPTARPAAVVYEAAPESPVQQPLVAAAGSRILVSVLASEPIDVETNPPRLTAENGGSVLSFRLVDQDELGAQFEATVTATHADGVYRPRLSVVDLAGNPSGEVSFDEPPIVVHTSIPELVIDQNQVSYVRAPVGSASIEAHGAFEIPAGPRFVLSPPEELSSDEIFAPGVFRFSDDTVPTLLRLWSDPDRTVLLGSVRPAPDGSFRREDFNLVRFDTAAVYVSGADDAGNETAPVPIATSWYVTTSRRTDGTPADRILSTPRVEESWGQSRGAPSGVDLGGPDSNAARAVSPWGWRRLDPSPEPAPRAITETAFDEVRGRMVVFSGVTQERLLLAGTWEWDGTRWYEAPTTAEPPPRDFASMAYDSWRQRVVLFGGLGTRFDRFNDLWEWDGRLWQERIPVDGVTPEPRAFFTSAFDAQRGRLVVFGGSSSPFDLDAPDEFPNTWEWDGERWREMATDGPEPRTQHEMAYDEARGRVVLYGGGVRTDDARVEYTTTWEWDGQDWLEIPSSVGASANENGRIAAGMYYDPIRQNVVSCGGVSVIAGLAFVDCHNWNGASWTEEPAGATSPARSGFDSLVFDRARGAGALFGLQRFTADGTGIFDANDLWVFENGNWREATPVAPDGPGPRNLHGMSAGALPGALVLFGGHSGAELLGDTWRYRGSRWERLAPAASPGPLQGHAMAHDPASDRVLLFGGEGPGGAHLDTWAFDGSTWLQVATSSDANPGSRPRAAMAADVDRGRVVLYGGGRDTWEWDGSQWLDVTPAAGEAPPIVDGCRLAYDRVRAVTVLFGGADQNNTPSNEVWEYDGTQWRNATPSADVEPLPRTLHSMVYDQVRERVIVIGGQTSNGTLLSDAWEWDGTTWTEVGASSRPTNRAAAAAAYSPAHARTILVGGLGSNSVLADTWETIEPSGLQPAHQLIVDLPADLRPEAVEELRVRAYCGGTGFSSDNVQDGAALLIWHNRATPTRSTGWLTLSTNSQSIAPVPPYLSDPAASLLEYGTTDPAEILSVFGGRDARMAVQCRSVGMSDPRTRAAVAADFIEVRVRYAQP